MEAIDVFAGIYSADDGFFIDVFRWGRLDEDAVDCGVGIEIGDDFEEFCLGGFGREFDFDRVETEIGAGAGFGTDVNGGGGIVSNQHNGEAWSDAFCFESSGFVAAFFEDGGGDGFSVDDARLVHAG